jgi:succinate-semialdehyde dehydrogenase / glutarate-semialdehyde dehydrogenase
MTDKNMKNYSGVVDLKDPGLLRTQALVEGWISGKSGERFPVFNPSDGAQIVTLPRLSSGEVDQAVTIAQTAFMSWSKESVDERRRVMLAWSALVQTNAEDVARILTTEQGKPYREALSEVIYAATFIDWFADQAQRAEGSVLPSHQPGGRLICVRQPVGVGAAITPWNFPAAMITRKVAPALAAGCSVVVKPSEFAPLTALALAELALRAGLPEGVLNVVTGDRQDAAMIGSQLTGNAAVRKISFTGSTAVGKQLMAQSAESVKCVSLELGGNAPFIVFEDADIDQAVNGLIGAKFRNAGQACVAANRVLVHADIHDRFVGAFVAATNKLVVGDGFDDATDIGPLINSSALEKVERHIDDALRNGAKLLTGGRRHVRGGSFFEPTVLVDVSPKMAVSCEETFGPVAAISNFHDEAEAIQMANDTEYGLAAYFYSQGRERCWRVAEALDAGIVCENTVSFSAARAPFGGFKQSGTGREGGEGGLNEWTELKYKCIGGLS